MGRMGKRFIAAAVLAACALSVTGCTLDDAKIPEFTLPHGEETEESQRRDSRNKSWGYKDGVRVKETEEKGEQ